MRGVVYIESESTVRDRRIVQTLDVEGFSSQLGDPMEIVKKAVHDALEQPGAYTVRAIHDDGWTTRKIYSESHGQGFRP